MVLVYHDLLRSEARITTNGREASLNDAKEQFLGNWQKCRTASNSCTAPLYLNVEFAFA